MYYLQQSSEVREDGGRRYRYSIARYHYFLSYFVVDFTHPGNIRNRSNIFQKDNLSVKHERRRIEQLAKMNIDSKIIELTADELKLLYKRRDQLVVEHSK